MPTTALKISLTLDQQEAKENILAHLEMGGKYVSLLGSAGSGKTYLAQDLAHTLSNRGHTIYACAPTHKAADVLNSAMPVEAQTVCSFLDLQLVPNYEGAYALRKKTGSDDPAPGIVLLDEASMVGMQRWKHIEKSEYLQWVLIGDPAQLPPVKEKPSPALEQPGRRLTSIVRQAEGNPIIDFATRIRKGEDYLNTASFSGEGVALTTDRNSLIHSALQGFRQWTRNTPPAMRVLAYRNEVVDTYNRHLRQLLHRQSNLPQFVEGDWIMMKDSYREDEVLIVRNSEEVKVMQATRTEVPCVGEFWDVWQLVVIRANGRKAHFPVLADIEIPRYKAKLADLKQEAIEATGTSTWKHYYRLLERFPDYTYCFALTVHRSQGSTFETAYVDHRDLMNCRNPAVRKALIYVAATRASYKLALLTR